MALLSKRRNLNLHINILPETTKTPKCFSTPFILSVTINADNEAVQCLSDLEKLQILGSGNGGTVYKVCHKHDKTVYALKVIRYDARKTFQDQILQEIEILCSLKSPFVLGCSGVFKNCSGDIAVVMEYMDAGSLHDLVKTSGTLSEAAIAYIAHQALLGLNHLHANKIVHRDIKPANLLVNHQMEVKIADFGVSKRINGSDDPCKMCAGTCAYMSPEILDPETYGYSDFAGDVWGLGLTLMELYIGHHPYKEPGKKANSTGLMWDICFGETPTLPEDASESFRDFINCCLQKDWKKRWSASQLLCHPFVRGQM